MKSINAFVITEHKKSIALLERLGFIRKELLENDTENKAKNSRNSKFSDDDDHLREEL